MTDNITFHDQLLELSALESCAGELTPETVHRIRVAIKQIRARLKLLRTNAGKPAGSGELVTELKTLSNKLSGQRDRDVAIATLFKILKKYPGQKTTALVNRLVEIISARQQASTCDQQELAELMRQIRAGLLSVSTMAVTADTLRDGIQRADKKMCKAGEQALASESCEDLHAWRKRVKTLLYQNALCDAQSAWKKTGKTLDKLGKQLGQLNDLCFVEAMLDSIQTEYELAISLEPLLNRFLRERQHLLRKVRKYYRQLCSGDPEN